MAEIKPYSKCNYEDLDLLCKSFEKTSRVAYILTIGVVSQWRRQGIATILLNKLIENVTTNPMLEDCKAVYLHVLTTNTAGIYFYEKSFFKRHKFLPLYYLINNSATCDGYCYVRYLNDGRPPQTILYPFHRISIFLTANPILFLNSFSFLSNTGHILGFCCLIISHGPVKWTKTLVVNLNSTV